MSNLIQWTDDPYAGFTDDDMAQWVDADSVAILSEGPATIHLIGKPNIYSFDLRNNPYVFNIKNNTYNFKGRL